ncbi:MAG TPA: right-handed parallel beta-helix repeat-containing protein [Chloroflexota bacterium]|nr:right-handed parallel beta-helix repeat-containing protein [Chloroflexota bacterium]
MQRRFGVSARLGMALTGLVLLLPASPPALAAPTTLWVNVNRPPGVPPGTSCDNPGFTRIQDAVNFANAGDRINVCPGTYVEQVTISSAAKDNITLRSVSAWQAIIKAPAVLLPPTAKAIVRVSSSHNVTILAFTITGPGPGPCGSIDNGVRVDTAGSANIYGNHIIDIRDEPLSGCQNGVAIQVGRAAEATTGSANIFGNVIERFQKNGMTVSNIDSNANVIANRVLGIGPTILIAQNGVQVSSGATARVQYNFIANAIYTPQTVTSTGVLLFSPGAVDISRNTIPRDDTGIYAFGGTAASSVYDNDVRSSSFDGITVDMTNNYTVNDNDSVQNTFAGVGIYEGSKSNTISNNDLEHNKDSGILLDMGTSNTIRGNHVRSNGTTGADTTDGLRANATSTGNIIQSNFMKGNVTHDCHDDSGTPITPANSWVNNRGDTQNKPGLCRPSDNDDQDDRDDRSQAMQVSMNAGWDPAYPWYTADALAGEYNWATSYASVDTQSLLRLAAELPAVRNRPAPNPTAD